MVGPCTPTVTCPNPPTVSDFFKGLKTHNPRMATMSFTVTFLTECTGTCQPEEQCPADTKENGPVRVPLAPFLDSTYSDRYEELWKFGNTPGNNGNTTMPNGFTLKQNWKSELSELTNNPKLTDMLADKITEAVTKIVKARQTMSEAWGLCDCKSRSGLSAHSNFSVSEELDKLATKARYY